MNLSAGGSFTCAASYSNLRLHCRMASGYKAADGFQPQTESINISVTRRDSSLMRFKRPREYLRSNGLAPHQTLPYARWKVTSSSVILRQLRRRHVFHLKYLSTFTERVPFKELVCTNGLSGSLIIAGANGDTRADVGENALGANRNADPCPAVVWRAGSSENTRSRPS